MEPTERVKKSVLDFVRAIGLATGLGLLVSGVDDLGLLVGQGLWLGLSRGGFAVFKMIIGVFLTVANIKTDIVYPEELKYTKSNQTEK